MKKDFFNQVYNAITCCHFHKDNEHERFFSEPRGHTNPTVVIDKDITDPFTYYGLEFKENTVEAVPRDVLKDDLTNYVLPNPRAQKCKTTDSGCGQSIDDSLILALDTKNDTRQTKTKKEEAHFKDVYRRKFPEKLSSIEDGIIVGRHNKKLSPSDFDFLNVIGKGSFGKVMLAKRKTNQQTYAIKVLNKRMISKRSETQHILSERSVLIQTLNHPYLVTLHYAFATDAQLFFVLDFINGGELFYHLQRERTLSEPRAKFYAAEICCALSYMHSKGIVYRDLKPENILLDRDGHIVLTDFGLCKENLHYANSKTTTFCGTPEYLAPEIILKKPYSRSVDWWTLGAVLYEMLFGLPPFYSKNIKVMYDAIVNKPINFRPTVSSRAKDILSLLLKKNPSKRLGSGSTDGQEVKSHPFFQDIKWGLIEKRQVSPPYIPCVTSDTDIRNIDPNFTKERASIGAAEASATAMQDNGEFKDFDYAITESFYQS